MQYFKFVQIKHFIKLLPNQLPELYEWLSQKNSFNIKTGYITIRTYEDEQASFKNLQIYLHTCN